MMRVVTLGCCTVVCYLFTLVINLGAEGSLRSNWTQKVSARAWQQLATDARFHGMRMKMSRLLLIYEAGPTLLATRLPLND